MKRLAAGVKASILNTVTFFFNVILGRKDKLF